MLCYLANQEFPFRSHNQLSTSLNKGNFVEFLSVFEYRAIKKSLCTWWLQYRKLQVMYLAQSDCLAANRQGQGDTRLTLTPSVIPNSKYVIMESDWNCLKYFCVFFVLNSTRCAEPFWSSCIIAHFLKAIWIQPLLPDYQYRLVIPWNLLFKHSNKAQNLY
jgi:hypothetical protein